MIDRTIETARLNPLCVAGQELLRSEGIGARVFAAAKEQPARHAPPAWEYHE